jgi:hypothetical protein
MEGASPRLSVLSEELSSVLNQIVRESKLPRVLQEHLSVHIQVNLSSIESINQSVILVKSIRRILAKEYEIDKKGRFHIIKQLQTCSPTSMLFIVHILMVYKNDIQGFVDFVVTYLGDDFDQETTAFIAYDSIPKLTNPYLIFLLKNYPPDELGTTQEERLANSFEVTQTISAALWTIRKWLVNKIEG